MTDEEYKNMSVKEFTKAAKNYESDHAGIYKMCKKDYPDILEELEKEEFSDLLDAGCGPAPMISLLAEKYPERRIYAVDTLCASFGQGLLVYLAAQQRLQGKNIDEVRAYVEQIRPQLCHWFTVDDLQHLKRGGRVSAAAAAFGTVLNIKPILHVDDEGHLIPVNKVQGRITSIKALAKRMQETAIDPDGQVVFISHGDCEKEAEKLAEIVRESIGAKEIVINPIGPIVGTHSGPGTIALFFLGTKR